MDDESIFANALKKSAGVERSAYLDEVCAGDEESRARLEGLLAAHENPDAFFDRSRPLWNAETDDACGEQPGIQIGRYKLLQRIGEGGFGVVYMAEQREPIERRVAVKIIKPGMDSQQVIGRFEAERQALAMMEHPNIAKVFDAGTTDSGRPFFVMELVRGISITEFCDQRQLNPRKRLDLFIGVCRAIQHAHQKGIIHRDIKPSNILVGLHDGEPTPKVIDFGVSKALQHRLTEKTVFTQFGQVIGTLEYMSPEQAEMNQLDIDTRSDVYSLGAVLYELLAGTTPFDGRRLRSAAFDEMLRIIRDEEPPRPSLRLSTEEELAAISARREMEPAKLPGLVRGELDWIVMKALDKQRNRRYETAEHFATDIQRYLSGDAVEASPPSKLYRLRKISKKHRTAISIVALFLIVSLLGTAVSMRQWFRAERESAARLEETSRARSAEGKAVVARENTERSLRRANAIRIAAQSESLRSQRPRTSALLAIEAIKATRRYDGSVESSAWNAMLQSFKQLGGRPLLGQLGRFEVSHASAEGKWLLTVTEDHAARLWDLKAEQPWSSSTLLEGHDAEIVSAAFSPDINWLATGSSDATIRLWDLRFDGQVPPSIALRGHGDAIKRIAISNNSRWLVTGSLDGTARIWDLSSRDKTIAKWVLPSAFAPPSAHAWYHIVFSPDDNWLVTANHNSNEVTTKLWKLDERLKELTPTELPGDEWILAELNSVFSPDSRWLVTTSHQHIRHWDLTAEDPAASSRVLNEGPGYVVFSPDGKWLAVSDSAEKRLLLRNLTKGSIEQAPVEIYKGTTSAKIRISSDSRWLLWNTSGRTPHLWDLTAENPATSAWSLPFRERYVQDIQSQLSPSGRWFVTRIVGDDTGNLVLWDLHSEERLLESIEILASETARYGAGFRFSSDDRWLLTQGMGEAPRLWDLSKGRRAVSSVVFPNTLLTSKDNRLLVAKGTNALDVVDLSAKIDPVITLSATNLVAARPASYLKCRASIGHLVLLFWPK